MDNTYVLEMERDIREYIESDIEREEWIGRKEDLEEYLNEELFCSDITGNRYESYYGSREQSRESVIKNMKLLGEALSDFCVESKTVSEKFIEEDWEYFDTLIRCSILSQYIGLVLDDLEKSGYFK